MLKRNRVILLLLMLSMLHVDEGRAENVSYVVVPMDLSTWGSTHQQYLHLYITGTSDTDLEITIPTNSFSQCVSLRGGNNWAWKEEYHLEGSMLTDAIAKGIRIEAAHPINIYVTRNSTYAFSLTSFHSLPVTEQATSFLLSPYIRRASSSSSNPFYVIATGNQQTDIEISRYDVNTGMGTVLESKSLQPFEVYYKEVTGTGQYDAIGLEVNATQPVSVFVGNERTYIPFEYAQSISAYTQIPDIESFKSLYVIGPLLDDFEANGFSVLVVFSEADTEVNVIYDPAHTNSVTMKRNSHTCSCGVSAGRCTIACSKQIRRGAFVEFAIQNAKQPIILECSKPCLAILVKHSQSSGYQRPQGYIAPIMAPSPKSTQVRFFVPDIAEASTIQETFVYITVPTDDISGVILDEKAYSQMLGEVKVSNVETWSVLTIQVSPGAHSVRHSDDKVLIAVHLHGTSYRVSCSTCYSSSFGFPALLPGNNVPPMTTTTVMMTTTMKTSSSSATEHPTDISTSSTSTTKNVAAKRISTETIGFFICFGVLVICVSAVIVIAIMNCKKMNRLVMSSSKLKQPQQFSNITYEGSSSASTENQYQNGPNISPSNQGENEMYANAELDNYTKLDKTLQRT